MTDTNLDKSESTEKKRLGRPRKEVSNTTTTTSTNPELQKLHDAVDESLGKAPANSGLTEDVEISDNTTTTVEEVVPAPVSDLLQPKIVREYSQGNKSAVAPENEEYIPEPVINHSVIPPVLPPPPNQNEGTSSSNNNTFNPTPPTSGSGNSTQPQQPKSVNPNISNLTSKEKKAAIEKTAEIIIANYAQLMPLLFKKLASVNMNKMKQLNLEGKLLWMLQLDDGNGGVITPKQFFERYNSKVESLFVVTEAMKEEVRQPLIDVLMEKDIAMTPTQRLLAAVGGQVIMFAFQAWELKQEINGAVDTFKLLTNEYNNSGSPKPPADNTAPDIPSPSPASEQNENNTNENNSKDESVPFVETRKSSTSLTMVEVLDETSPKITVEHIAPEGN